MQGQFKRKDIKISVRARSSFTSHFSWRRGTDPTLGGEVNPGKLAGYCLCLGLETPNQPAPTLPAVLATAQPPALVTALAEENLKNRGRDSDSSGRESAELDLRQGRAGKVPLANILVLNLVARFAFPGKLCCLIFIINFQEP